MKLKNNAAGIIVNSSIIQNMHLGFTKISKIGLVVKKFGGERRTLIICKKQHSVILLANYTFSK